MNGWTWIGAFTHYANTRQVMEDEMRDRYILGYRILEREDGNGYDTWTWHNSDRRATPLHRGNGHE